MPCLRAKMLLQKSQKPVPHQNHLQRVSIRAKPSAKIPSNLHAGTVNQGKRELQLRIAQMSIMQPSIGRILKAPSAKSLITYSDLAGACDWLQLRISNKGKYAACSAETVTSSIRIIIMTTFPASCLAAGTSAETANTQQALADADAAFWPFSELFVTSTTEKNNPILTELTKAFIIKLLIGCGLWKLQYDIYQCWMS